MNINKSGNNNGSMNITEFLKSPRLPLIDARSESEFKQGHIPGALNHPILNDTERKKVGICYKREGKEAAISLGYKLVEHKFDDKLKAVQKDISFNPALVYCWRGGLRSKIFTDVLQRGGLSIRRLENGYKAYRQWALKTLKKPYPIIVLGGATGTGKTEVLHLLKERGEQVLDLEGLANHKGSAFGGIGMPEQPTNEQFENELALKFHRFDQSRPIWVENESRHLGKVKLPDHLYTLLREAKVIVIQQPLQIRIDRIIKEYAVLPQESLIASIQALKKRLGHKRMTDAITHLKNGEDASWIALMLQYYDKMYDYGNSLRENHKLYPISIKNNAPDYNIELILNQFREIVY